MADDYTIHIKATVDGGSDSGGGDNRTETQQEVDSNNELIKELLSTKSYSTEPSEPVQKRGPGRPKKDKSVELPEEKESKRENSPLEDVLEKLKSFVSIFDGHNGRFTKVLNGIHRTVTAWQNTVHAANTAANTTATVTATVGQVAQTAAATTAATTSNAAKMGAMFTSVVSKIGPVGIAIGVLSAGIIATIATIKALNHALESMKEIVGRFSVAVEMARAKEEVAVIQRQMKSAAQIGGEVASIQSGQTEINNTLNKIWTNFYDLIYPFLKVGQSLVLAVLKQIQTQLEVLVMLHDFVEKTVETILTYLAELPLVGKLYKRILEWMQQDDIKKAESTKMNERIEGIFTSPMTREKNNKRVESRFL